MVDDADNGTPKMWDNDIAIDGSELLEASIIVSFVYCYTQMKVNFFNHKESSTKEITTLESYIHFLRQHQVIVPYNQSLLDFVLQDFSPSETTLKVS